MANLNDSKIMNLKVLIEGKKKELKKLKQFSPITNCSIELDRTRYNINVLTKEQLIALVVKLQAYMTAAKELELLDEYVISGYKVEEWISDIKTKLDVLTQKDEEKKLKFMENKLDKLLSEDKKTELELSEIENILKKE
ncbi:hypothetical protein ACFHWD_03195 [Clostridium sp. MT-14]|uniref:hypothetical protein n=1 Tax=Clostridium sp. MT-14 TaxID=3348360 RepID=UPI0035F33AE0